MQVNMAMVHTTLFIIMLLRLQCQFQLATVGLDLDLGDPLYVKAMLGCLCFLWLGITNLPVRSKWSCVNLNENHSLKMAQLAIKRLHCVFVCVCAFVLVRSSPICVMSLSVCV
ncbi:unnamed protein product [Boreogadus saida]